MKDFRNIAQMSYYNKKTKQYEIKKQDLNKNNINQNCNEKNLDRKNSAKSINS